MPSQQKVSKNIFKKFATSFQKIVYGFLPNARAGARPCPLRRRSRSTNARAAARGLDECRGQQRLEAASRLPFEPRPRHSDHTDIHDWLGNEQFRRTIRIDGKKSADATIYNSAGARRRRLRTKHNTRGGRSTLRLDKGGFVLHLPLWMPPSPRNKSDNVPC